LICQRLSGTAHVILQSSPKACAKREYPANGRGKSLPVRAGSKGPKSKISRLESKNQETLMRYSQFNPLSPIPATGSTLKTLAKAAASRGRPLETEASRMATGTVKGFNTTKSYGFIVPDEGGKDIFAH
jgi:hypothetical protein